MFGVFFRDCGSSPWVTKGMSAIKKEMPKQETGMTEKVKPCWRMGITKVKSAIKNAGQEEKSFGGSD
jgi:hypothetical protein